ncbi:MAG: sugar phosphate isomerase/epimerase family protein [Blastocatellia bacterium]|nr:sugar phosphate isomerase/epimerase family protein [Blastocatellia bacterium]
MITRREFLSALPAGAITAAISARAQAAPLPVRIGCQTNAWRIDPADFNQVLDVLGKLKSMGFDGYETGFRNIQGQFKNAAAARRQLERTGLQFFATHIFLEQYDPQTRIAPMELVRAVTDGASTLGAQRLILSGGGLLQEGKIDPDALRRKADGLNAAGRYCRSKGLKLAYHNHGPEFARNGLEIEGLYRLTDSALVDFVVDCGWASRSGADVTAFFKRHHRRIVGLHIRDFKADTQVPLGQGDFPLATLAAEIKRVKWPGWAINEEERLSGEKPGESAVAPARESLRRALGR